MIEKTKSIPNAIGWPIRIAESSVIFELCEFSDLWFQYTDYFVAYVAVEKEKWEGRRARVMARSKTGRYQISLGELG